MKPRLNDQVLGLVMQWQSSPCPRPLTKASSFFFLCQTTKKNRYGSKLNIRLVVTKNWRRRPQNLTWILTHTYNLQPDLCRILDDLLLNKKKETLASLLERGAFHSNYFWPFTTTSTTNTWPPRTASKNEWPRNKESRNSYLKIKSLTEEQYTQQQWAKKEELLRLRLVLAALAGGISGRIGWNQIFSTIY